MIALIWFIWVTQQLLILIILLNFLIALVSQSYENVKSKEEIYKYKQRVEMNRESL
jgi:hypothetical protein